MITDYFGNKLEVGDIVLRNNNSTFDLVKVVRVTPNAVGLSRTKWQQTSSRYDYKTRQVVSKQHDKPLYIQYFQGINLSKLNNSQIQETIKNYINEI